GNSVCGPARMADTDVASERGGFQPTLEIDQLALRPPAFELAFFDRGDTGRVIAAIFEALERIDDQWRDRTIADDSNDTAHLTCPFVSRLPRPAVQLCRNCGGNEEVKLGFRALRHDRRILAPTD